MPPPNGSDSERLMAQIEAYLRTGEGPPAAPEPAATGAFPVTRAHQPEEHHLGSGASAAPPPAMRGTRRPRAFGPASGAVRGRSRGEGGTSGGPGLAARGANLFYAPLRWTPARAALVMSFILALLLLPVVWPSRSSTPGADGPDHASPAPAGPGYSFLVVNRSGTPVRWDPCAAIPYQLELAAAPAWAQTDIVHAIAILSSATGIDFAYDGRTNQFPTWPVPVGSGTEDTPVVIAWATPDQSRSLGLPVSLAAGAGSGAGPATPSDGVARTVPVLADDQVTGHKVYVGGTVVIGAAASQLPAGFGAGGEGILLLHELGRLLGLGRTDDAREIMDPQVLSTGATGLGPGDRAGLKRLGAASGCLKIPQNVPVEPVL